LWNLLQAVSAAPAISSLITSFLLSGISSLGHEKRFTFVRLESPGENKNIIDTMPFLVFMMLWID
jgi:hypothetical protein